MVATCSQTDRDGATDELSEEAPLLGKESLVKHLGKAIHSAEDETVGTTL